MSEQATAAAANDEGQIGPFAEVENVFYIFI